MILEGYGIQSITDETGGSRASLAGSGDDWGIAEKPSAAFHRYLSQPRRTNQTIWIFSGSSTARYGNTIRSSGNYHRRDSWKLNAMHGFDVYLDNLPTNRLVSLSPLFSSENNPKDIESVQKRIASNWAFGQFSTEPSFPDNSTNSATMTAGSATKTIGSIFMNRGLRSDASTADEMGIRGTSGNNLAYTNGQTFSWFGSGILNKPIGDFTVPSTPEIYNLPNDPFFGNAVHLRIYGQIIPEPEEYALVFGIFAIGFFLFRRHFKRNRQL